MITKRFGGGRTHNGNTSQKSYKYVTLCPSQSQSASLLAQAQSQDVYCAPARYSPGFQEKTRQILCRISGVLASNTDSFVRNHRPKKDSRAKHLVQRRAQTKTMAGTSQRQTNPDSASKKAFRLWRRDRSELCQRKQLIRSSNNGYAWSQKKRIREESNSNNNNKNNPSVRNKGFAHRRPKPAPR